jgi:hypothetical protein
MSVFGHCVERTEEVLILKQKRFLQRITPSLHAVGDPDFRESRRRYYGV